MKMLDHSALALQESVLNADDYIKSLLLDIYQAKQTIDLETYIYANDDVGTQIAHALCHAAARDVKVRVMVDGVGTPFFHTCLLQMEAAGVEVRVFHPLLFNFSQFKRSNYRSSFISKIMYHLGNINYRNHRKTCIIDHHIIYVGSVNIDQRHLSKELGGQGWQDMVVNLRNVDVKDLLFAYDIAWDRFPLPLQIKTRLIKVNLDPIFRMNYSRHLRRTLYKSLLRKIATSKNHIWVTSAYFNPNYFVLKRLMRAAKKGIDVRLILPDESDVPIMKMVTATFYSQLIKSGVSIYEYLPGILHAKAINIDDWYSIGSSNFNSRSLRHDLEVDASLQTIAAKQSAADFFNHAILHSRKLTLVDLKKQPFYKRLFVYFLLLGKYFY